MSSERYREPVPPVAAGVPRPRWSVMIPTYNCAGYLRHTLAAVLEQDQGPERMQIEVVDDCSTADDPESVVRELGPGRVTFFRQPRNMGHVATFNTCLRRARGEIVHLLHGDDVVRHGFYASLERAYDARPEIGAAFCRYVQMDGDGRWNTLGPLLRPESGILDGWLERLATGQLLQVCSMTVRRSTYEHLGGFDSRIRRYGEDWEMWVRIAAHYPVWFEVEPFAFYRVHDSSLSGESGRFAENMRDLRQVIDFNREHLPPDRADELTRIARRRWAQALIRRARRRTGWGDLRFPGEPIREAFVFEASVGTAVRAVGLLGVWGARLALSRVRRKPATGAGA